jgi:hypothetical protein
MSTTSGNYQGIDTSAISYPHETLRCGCLTYLRVSMRCITRGKGIMCAIVPRAARAPASRVTSPSCSGASSIGRSIPSCQGESTDKVGEAPSCQESWVACAAEHFEGSGQCAVHAMTRELQCAPSSERDSVQLRASREPISTACGARSCPMGQHRLRRSIPFTLLCHTPDLWLCYPLQFCGLDGRPWPRLPSGYAPHPAAA